MPGSQCRYCLDNHVLWKVIAGRPVLHNFDGTPHRCKATAPVVPAVPVRGKRIVGPFYKPFVHEPGCAVPPPWEVCPCQKVAA